MDIDYAIWIGGDYLAGDQLEKPRQHYQIDLPTGEDGQPLGRISRGLEVMGGDPPLLSYGQRPGLRLVAHYQNHPGDGGAIQYFQQRAEVAAPSRGAYRDSIRHSPVI